MKKKEDINPIQKKYLSEDFEEFTTIGPPHLPYVASKSLVEAINLAILLERPLLLKGEPGCGKTVLAEVVAYELYKDELGEKGYEKYYLEWNIKSTSKAQDGLYMYDHIGRLRDAQLIDTPVFNAAEKQKAMQHQTYLKKGVLWQAFKKDKPTVLLIDEIDKADLDFPNDLLLELDKKRFNVSITGEKIEAAEGCRPIIFITSNDEKDLPGPFLRRCLFYYVNFPSDAQLTAIINCHFSDPSAERVKKAVDTFLKIRAEMEADSSHSGKKVSTSELLDWFKVLQHRMKDAEMKGDWNIVPFHSVLLKKWRDHKYHILKQSGNFES